MSIKEKFLDALNQLDRDLCITILTDGLDSKECSLDDAFDLVAKALSLTVDCKQEEIWQEHVKTQIVRSALEILSFYMLKEMPNLNQKEIAVICPNGEYHELGARFVSEYIRRLGFKPLFFGNSLPNSEIVKLVKTRNIDGLAFSVSNFYTLHELNPLIQQINEANPDLPLYLGGTAIGHNSKQVEGNNLHICESLDALKVALEDN